MAGNLGRYTLIKKNNTNLVGITSISIDWGGESVDLTTGENDGVRLLATETGMQQVDLSIEGITKDDEIMVLALGTGTKMLTDISIEFAIINPSNTTAATLTGNFVLDSKGNSNPMNEGISFSATLKSSGPWVYTPESA